MDIYQIIVFILFVVAALDLIVGVSNDAVNFLNSALGSKVGTFKTIMVIASIGIFVGAFSSSGMMEVARKGVFNPQFFTFEGVMFLFLAVMLTDIILLDFFNEIGMPTSTTVSIVFELLGAATMIAVLLIGANQGGASELTEFLNIPNAVKIISGIFLSILIAFTSGVVIQFFSRWMLSFNYEKKLDTIGPVFAGIAITAITYFLFVKGIKSSSIGAMDFSKAGYSFIDIDAVRESLGMKDGAKVKFLHLMDYYRIHILLGLFVIWTLINYILRKVAGINPLKTVVFAGTFALAMAFAGNDLVNFIGVPIGAYQANEIVSTTGAAANEFLMTPLTEKIPVPRIFLTLSGLIMIVTLWTSKKAKKVTETEINLARQSEGEERFKPNMIARGIVALGTGVGNGLSAITPAGLKESINNSYVAKVYAADIKEEDKPAFDLVRASVNLMMASIIIAIATFKKMPLSTTYVSFMVAMGTSLADKAWGADSAGSRVAGVVNVVGGWLATAAIAFVASAIFAWVLFKFKMIGIVIVCLLAVVALIRSNIAFKKKNG